MSETPVLYQEIYRCELCSQFDNPDPNGIIGFVRPGSNQTFPVSHFGDIANSLIWLVATNPKGDRNDPNVGHLVSQYDMRSRSMLSAQDAQSVYNHFNSYFKNSSNIHSFFDVFLHLLDGIRVNDHKCTFENGKICAVDAIKCPTDLDWQVFVRKPEGKKVWHNCLGNKSRPGPNRFLIKQIILHKPLVLIFVGTDGLVPMQHKGSKNKVLTSLIPDDLKTYLMDVKYSAYPKRVSISLGGAGRISRAPVMIIDRLHHTVGKIIGDSLN